MLRTCTTTDKNLVLDYPFGGATWIALLCAGNSEPFNAVNLIFIIVLHE